MHKILVTGGAGYIGSHVCLDLLNSGYLIHVIDNFSVGSPESLKRVQDLTGKTFPVSKIDLRDKVGLNKIFSEEKFDTVMHFASLKAVGESVLKPLEYYDNNIIGAINLFEVMQEKGVNNFIFSSSACVYGDPEKNPITEDFPLKPTNPYGQNKVIIEQIIKDISVSDKEFKAMILRYFNPVGADKSGMIGEDPDGIPNNLVPFIARVAVGKLEELKVYGNDYPTKDGTGVRDYIHIKDLSLGHLKALEKLESPSASGVKIYNLGTGKGYSVMEVLNAFEKACGKKLPFKIVERRPGDTATVFTDPGLAEKELDWKATRDLQEMCDDVWRWQSKNPNGYVQ